VYHRTALVLRRLDADRRIHRLTRMRQPGEPAREQLHGQET
jgi:hypothetical protein